jgi:antirestriction protein
MGLAIGLAPFKHIKAFDDLEIFLRAVHADHNDDEDNVKTEDYYSLIADSIGFSDEQVDEYRSLEELTQAMNSTDETESWSAVRNLNRGGY